MLAAFQKDDALVADLRHAIQHHEEKLWWLGQSGFLWIREGKGLLLDPYLSDSLTRKYAGTDKPHTRITEQVIDPALLASTVRILLITSSHAHTDHLDAATLLPLLAHEAAPRLLLPAATLSTAAARLGTGVSAAFTPIDAGESASVDDIHIHAVPAAHNKIERDEQGRCKYLGYVIRWGETVVYHSGDTLWDDAIIDAVAPFEPDVAILPINGNLPERRVAGNLDGPEAARFAQKVRARCVIPCHYDMFEFNTARPESFIDECERLGQPFHVLRNGEGALLNRLLSPDTPTQNRSSQR